MKRYRFGSVIELGIVNRTSILTSCDERHLSLKTLEQTPGAVRLLEEGFLYKTVVHSEKQFQH